MLCNIISREYKFNYKTWLTNKLNETKLALVKNLVYFN